MSVNISHIARVVSLLCAFLIPAFLVWRLARKSYQKVRDDQPPLEPGEFLAAYASESLFKAPKNMVYEAVGRLKIEAASVTFRGEWFGGKRLELRFTAASAKVSWIGRTFRTGIAVWFAIEQDGARHYFTSDAILRGLPALGSFKESARNLYRDVSGALMPTRLE